MTKEEIYTNFAKNIESERYKLGYSQKKMAEELGMSLSSYKSMINDHNVNVNLYTLYLAYQLTGKFIFELTDDTTTESSLIEAYRQLSPNRQKAFLTILELEKELSESDKAIMEKNGHKPHLVSCYALTGNLEDGMLLDSANVSTIDISSCDHFCPDTVDCAIRITSNHLHPVYHLHDILLVKQAPPRDGDTGIFIHKPTHRVYLRRFRQTAPAQLIPLNGIGQTITVDGENVNDMNQWIKFGRVIMKRTDQQLAIPPEN